MPSEQSGGPRIASEIEGKIAVGIAGWSYDDWNGTVYPRSVRDKLRYIARFVDVIEINSTFYRTPPPSATASWVQRTEDLPGLTFTAKVNKDMTHEQRLDPGTVRTFRNGVSPLVESGRLRHLLAQFRWDFTDSRDNREHLLALRNSLGDLTNLTLELRHKSWESDDAQEFLRDLGVTVANLDYPLSSNSFALRECNIGDDAYLRLHGRNAKAWFDRNAGRDETYNYAYSEAEVDDIVDRAVSLAKMSRSLTLVANNHFQGKEVMNALEIKNRLTGKKLDVPPDLANQYPRLKKIARNATGRSPSQPELF